MKLECNENGIICMFIHIHLFDYLFFQMPMLVGALDKTYGMSCVHDFVTFALGHQV